jgi:SAM-dependent methyltransferase
MDHAVRPALILARRSMNAALVNIRDYVLSALVWPFKKVLRQMVGEELYRQSRVTFLHQERGLGLDWRWYNSLRTVHPIRRDFGWQAGQTVDRYYTDEVFLPQHSGDIRGRVLEVGDRRYTERFGGAKVTKSDVLNVKPGDKVTTIVADLTSADHIPSNTFDCAILTFTLQFIYDVRAALRTLHRILKPGGVLLMAVPGISQIARYDEDNWGEYWRFTSRSARMLLAEVFRPESLTVQTHGNVLAALASLHGLISNELRREELDHCDRDYQLVITIRAVKDSNGI